ncbi:MAG TPA: pseudouridine-5'-phosphate glycosidase [Candidatus Dormibacteraeota bacterium]|nr:pseudouridine-5'-phosphate glycosidase [Candidatus Dormibacteraeota bacterium]
MSVRVAPEVAAALDSGRPVVALETSIVAHGLPHPQNLEAAHGCEEAIRAAGAVPAAVAVVDGELRVGLCIDDLERLAAPGANVRKLSSRDLGPALAAGATGATTVAGTVRAATLSGIRFMATGGIGGVHRGDVLDESADLFELARSAVVVVCAGPKTVLDVPATLERLESLAIPVLGYGCDECPAFYTARSGRAVSARVDDPGAVARAVSAVWATGGAGVVVAVPPPVELPGAAGLVEQALAELPETHGQVATPALLSRIRDLSGGGSVGVNVRLVVNNAAVAAQCAAALADGGNSRSIHRGANVT